MTPELLIYLLTTFVVGIIALDRAAYRKRRIRADNWRALSRAQNEIMQVDLLFIIEKCREDRGRDGWI